MRSKEILSYLEEAMEENEGTLTGNESIDDLEAWDSLAVVSFIALIDENYNLTLSPDKIRKAKSVSDLIALVVGASA